MEREIKFREWDEREGHMQYDIAIGHGRVISGVQEGYCDGFGNADIDGCKVMQYTGLKDKNGKEIYEGDIMEAEWPGSSVGKYRNKVVWNTGGFYFANAELAWWANMKVIGNIYENPEIISETIKKEEA